MQDPGFRRLGGRQHSKSTATTLFSAIPAPRYPVIVLVGVCPRRPMPTMNLNPTFIPSVVMGGLPGGVPAAYV